MTVISADYKKRDNQHGNLCQSDIGLSGNASGLGIYSTKIFGCMAALILIERNSSNVCFGVENRVFLLINL